MNEYLTPQHAHDVRDFMSDKGICMKFVIKYVKNSQVYKSVKSCGIHHNYLKIDIAHT